MCGALRYEIHTGMHMQTHSCGFCEEKVFPADAPKTLSDELSTFFSLLCIFNTKRRFSDVGKRVKFFSIALRSKGRSSFDYFKYSERLFLSHVRVQFYMQITSHDLR